MIRPLRIAFVSREYHPFGGGGIGVQVAGAARALAPHAEVTVLTSSIHKARHRELNDARDASLPGGVRFAFVEEPVTGEYGSYYGFLHLYSARVYEMLRDLYGDLGPDVVEFADFLGEGLVTVQARRAYESFLSRTSVCIRLHTSAEMASVLNGRLDDSFEAKMVTAAERHALRHADRLIAPGGDVLDTYRRFYGADALAPAVSIRPLVPPGPEPPATGASSGTERLRFLYMGRLERRKGVQALVRAFTALRREHWQLTVLGGDTDTAPLGSSMRDQLELAAAEHPLIEFVDGLPRAEIPSLIDAHHVVVCPSRWECWPSVILEALERNRPVLGTPTGGIVEMLAEPGAGWLASGTGDRPLADAIERLIDDKNEVHETIVSGAPRQAYSTLNDPEVFRRGYESLRSPGSLNGHPEPRSPRGMRAPLVSIVVPYYRMDRFLEDTLRSIFEQDYSRLEVIVVNDGSLRPEDLVLAELATRYPVRVFTKENAGLGSARNSGVALSRGRFVLPLDADNMIHPSFVSRCVEILERERSVAFVTSWSRYVDEQGEPQAGLSGGYQPIGNDSAATLEDNVAGDATAVIRRRIFDLGFRYSPDLTSYEDWQFYRELHLAGHFGRVIPERLLFYRVRADSMLREVGLQQTGLLFNEMQALLRERQVEWQSKSDSVSRL